MQIAIPDKPKPIAYGNPVYSALSELKDKLGPKPNRRDRVQVMICASILYGFDERHTIISLLCSCGLSADHVKRVLDERTGSVPGAHLWQQPDGGQYRLLEGGATPAAPVSVTRGYPAKLVSVEMVSLNTD